MPSNPTMEATSESVVSTQATITPTVAHAEPGITVDKIYSMEVYGLYYSKSVQLMDGYYSSTDQNEPYIVTLQPQIAFGDLNGDNIEDAAVLLTENGGGTGWFVSVAVIVSQGRDFIQIGQLPVDDRPLIQSLEIINGDIILKATIHSATDAMVEPTFEVNQSYRVVENSLIKMTQNSMINDGQARRITIDMPVDGSEVSNPLQVKGGMDIAPFENNLRLSIYGLSGNVLYQSGFMVSAAEPGALAVFDNLVSVEGLPSGDWVQIELAELSMVDGSIMTSNSVVVKIK